jgi:hypothetical protein
VRPPAPILAGGAPVVLTDVPLAIDPDEVRAFHGYKPLRPRPAGEVAAELEAARATVADLAAPRIAYRTVPVAAVAPHHLDLADRTRFQIPWIAGHWGAVEAVAAAVVTVGDGVERAVEDRRARGDLLGASALDSAGSAAAECLAEWANDHLCQRGVDAGLRVTNRVSPGLAGWPLAEQPALLALAPAALAGVRLGPAGLRPAKSVSFLVGLGAAARVDHYAVQCRRCWAADCPWRRAPAAATVHAA